MIAGMDSTSVRALLQEMAEERRALRRDAVLTVVTGVALAAGVLAPWIALEPVRPYAYLAAYLTGGIPTLVTAARALRARHLDIDLLMILAALAAAAVGEARDGAILLFLFQAAETLEDYAMGTTKRAVAGLMKLRPDTARRVPEAGDPEVVPVAEISVGEAVRVFPGERMPLDAEVTRGHSAVDQSTLTGESMPVDKGPGDAVYAGTVNGHGVLELRVTADASTSTLARMVELVTEAQAARAPSQRVSDWFGRRYTGGVLLGSALALLGFGTFGPSWSEAAYKTATLLVVASPCAVVISVPAAVLSALAAAARRGVLFKGGGALEAFGRVDAFGFDKTGTLTEGRMRLADLRALDGEDPRHVLRIAASLEAVSEHPLARAVVEAAQAKRIALASADGASAVPGHGIEGTLEGREVWVGNRRMAERRGARPSGLAAEALDAVEADGTTAVLVGEHRRVLGVLGVADTVRAEAAEALRGLRAAGITRMAMLTGDHRQVAHAVARRVGLRRSEVAAELLPEDKVERVRALARTHRVAYVGDGVNDAAALATAQVGVAMGVAGSDVAIETADVALLSNDLRRLPAALSLARRAQRVIRQNLAFALGVMAIMVMWTLFGDLPLPLGVVGHEGGTLIVVANGLRLLLPERPSGGGDTPYGGTPSVSAPVPGEQATD